MECGDYIKINSGLKQNNVPQGGRASAQKGVRDVGLLFLAKLVIGGFSCKIELGDFPYKIELGDFPCKIELTLTGEICARLSQCSRSRGGGLREIELALANNSLLE